MSAVLTLVYMVLVCFVFPHPDVATHEGKHVHLECHLHISEVQGILVGNVLDV